jgi:hypothetical protein
MAADMAADTFLCVVAPLGPWGILEMCMRFVLNAKKHQRGDEPGTTCLSDALHFFVGVPPSQLE